MYAIIETGGKQYRVKEGDVIDIELLKTDAVDLSFEKVLLFNDGTTTTIGAPHVPNVVVHAQKITETKGPKVIAFKYKKRKNIRRTVGHRQKYFTVKITKLGASK